MITIGIESLRVIGTLPRLGSGENVAWLCLSVSDTMSWISRDQPSEGSHHGSSILSAFCTFCQSKREKRPLFDVSFGSDRADVA